MPLTSPSKTDLISALKEEFLKEHNVYDGSFRRIAVYQAHSTCANNEDCMLTTFAYITTTNYMENKKESRAQWDSSWDI